MKTDENKTREQLINKLGSLRQRISKFENAEAEPKRKDEEKERLQVLLGTSLPFMPDGVVLLDKEGRFAYVNPAFLKLHGREAKDFIGKTVLQISPPITSPETLRTIAERAQKRLQTGGSVIGLEMDAIGRHNKLTPVSYSASTIRDQEGNITGEVVVIRDITEQKRMEERIAHLNLVLRAIRNVNRLIAREKNPDKLPEGACNLLIQTCGYHNAWIALLDESGTLVSAAEAGLGKDFVPMLELLKRGELSACGRKALGQSGVVITEDPPSTCADCPLAKKYAGRGAMSVRLEHGRKVYGLLSASIPAEFTQDEQERELFLEVAGDIAFALHDTELEDQRKQTEEKLGESEERFRSLVETTSDWTWEVDQNGIYTYVSPRINDLLGYQAEEVIGKTPFDLMPPDEAARVAEVFGAAVAERKPLVGLVNTNLHKDGRRITLETSGIPIFHRASGDFVGYRGIDRDITERKQAEEALQQSEQRFRQFFENEPEYCYIISPEGIMLDMNKAALEALGYDKEELVGKPLQSIYAPESLPKMTQLFAKWQETGALSDEEMTIMSKQGDRRTVLLSASMIRDSDEKAVHSVSVQKDITERKQAEEELREHRDHLQELVQERTAQLKEANEQLHRELTERKKAQDAITVSEDRFRELFNNMSSGVAVYEARENGEDFVFADFNRAGERIERVGKEDVIGKSVLVAFPAVKDFGLFDVFQRVWRGGKPEHFPVSMYQDQRIIGWRDNYVYKLPSGEIVAIYDDVTEHKQAEAKIEQSLKEKEVLLREINHRVKNNIQVISSLLNLQSRQSKDERSVQMFKDSRGRVKSIELVHEKLYQSQDLANIDFSDYIRSLTDDLFNAYTVNRNILKLEVNAENAVLDVNTAIPCGLIINELVSNCLKHAFPDRRHGTIRIELHPVKDNELALIVSDNGIGFPDLDFRNSETLGLQLVATLVRQLRGTIELDRNGGTTFRVSFHKVAYKEG